MIVTIDGPAGAGKTTIANKLAQKLGFHHVNSGMIYRGMTHYGLKKFKVALPANANKVGNHFSLVQSNIEIYWTQDVQHIIIEGEKLGHELTDRKIDQYVKYIADNLTCRAVVTEKLNKIAIKENLVIDGRDIGSKVFPWAEKKIFMDATVLERAKRRALEKKIKIGSEQFKELMEDIKIRDKNDRNREIAPLIIPNNAYYLDTTGKKIDEIVDSLYSHCRE